MHGNESGRPAPDSDPADDGRDGDVDVLNEVHQSRYAFSGCELDDSTDYFVVFAETVDNAKYKLHTTRRSQEDYNRNGMGRADWSIGNTTFWRNGSSGSAWRRGNDQKVRLAIEGEEAAPAGPPNSAATGRPRISGVPQVGNTLSVNTNPIGDSNGLSSSTFRYQWVSIDATNERLDIADATGRTYTLAPRMARRQVEVRVTFTDDDGYEEVVTSQAFPATGRVLAAPRPCWDVHWCGLLTVEDAGRLWV